MRLSVAALTFSLFLQTSISYQPCQAQYGQQRVGVSTYDPSKPKKEQETEFQANKLDRPIELPGVPSYTGKQYFVTGLAYPNAKSGPGYFLNFNTEHDKQQIKDWWTAALQSGSWRITFQDKNCVRGKMRDGTTCTVNVEDPIPTTKDKMKKCRAGYSISYHQINKK